MLQLPQPRKEYTVLEDERNRREQEKTVVLKRTIPRYRHRTNYIPRESADHGDGGAFPEIHVAQYPLGMGKKNNKGGNNVALTVGENGKAAFDSIVKRSNRGVGSAVQTRYEDLVAKNSTVENNDALKLPSEQEQEESAKRTSEILSKIVGRELEASRAVKIADNSAAAKSVANPKYIAYQPQGTDNAGKKNRVIRIVEAQTDPLEPPKFRVHDPTRDVPVEAPAPVLHAPTKPLTEEERKAWVIPPSISAWKNPQSFTIPLDKRLAADGRGLQNVTVSDKFASLSEALYIAENQSRAAIEARNKEKVFLLQKEKERQELELRELAAEARRERQQLHAPREPLDNSQTSGTDTGERERERLRMERKRELEKSIRLEAAGKKSKIARDAERDVSEKIALGMNVPKTALNQGEAAYDSRLFNQSQGLDSGFGAADDAYNIYNKPLFAEKSQYRPKATNDIGFGATKELDKIRNSDMFTTDATARAPQDTDVQFSKLTSKRSKQS